MPQFKHNSSRWSWLLLVMILAGGSALRWHLLGTKSISTDEAVGVALAQGSWPSFWREIWAFEGNMVLYYLLLRGWIYLGQSEVAIRSFSALFGVAAIVAIYFLADRFLGRKVALIGAALLAVHSFHVQFSQEARSYTLVVLLLILSAYFFLRALEAPNRKELWAAYLLVSVLAIYGHVLALLVVAAQWLSLRISRIRRIPPATLLWLGTGFGCLIAPMAAFVLLHNRGQIDWIPPPTWNELLESSGFLVGGQSNTLLAAYVVLCLLAMLHGRRLKQTNTARAPEEVPLRVFTFWLTFPIGFMLCFSLWRPLFFGRYLVLCVPALVLLAAQGMVVLERHFPRLGDFTVVLVLVMLALALNGVAQYYEGFPYDGNDWRSASRYILEGQRPGDAAFFYIPAGYRPFRYYAKRDTASAPSPEIVFPTSTLGHSDYRFKLRREQVEALTQGHERVWLVLYLEQSHPKGSVRSLLPEDLHLVEEKQFAGFHGTGNPIRVVLYSRDSPHRTEPTVSRRR